MSAKSGRALFFGPLLFVLAVMLGVWVAGRLDRHAQDAGFGIIETDRILVDLEGAAGSWAPWLDPEWSAQLTQAIATVPSFAADDPSGVDAVIEALGRFSFVAELGTPRVIWPDGLELPFRLRRPIACLAYQGRFWSVALEWNPPGDQPGPIGVILPGSSLTPPAFRGAFLPVIGQLSGPLSEVWVRNPALLGALSIADSFWVDLPPAEARRLGRFVIDASQDGAASVENPGVVLELEGGRRVWFGRSPYAAKSGELAVETKWEHVMGAMGYLDAGRDWTLVDVRWDRPDIAFVPMEEK